MPRKQKGQLPSGNIRIRVYDYIDPDGKQHYKSFTGRTRSEAQAKAAEWKANKKKPSSMTVCEAYKRYVDVNRTRLGASTLRTYIGYIKRIETSEFGQMDIAEAGNNDFQQFINNLTAETSVKYAKNVSSVLKRSIEVAMPDRRWILSFAPRIKEEKHIPTDIEIVKVLKSCTDPTVSIAIQLAMQGMCRRGEICAIEFKDVDYKNKTVHVHKAFTLNEMNLFVLAPTKTYESNRTFYVTDSLLSLIQATGRTKGFIVNISPSQLADRFRSVVKRSGVDPFGIHAIRHWANSKAVAMNIPAVYVEGIGGWSRGSSVRVKTYEHEIQQDAARYRDMFLTEIGTYCG